MVDVQSSYLSFVFIIIIHNHHRTKKLFPIGVAIEQILLVLESLLWVLDL